jgi:putative aminopeptidase FrvX
MPAPLDTTRLIRDLVAVPGPPGQEDAVRALVAQEVAALGYESRVDAKGNLLVGVGAGAFEPRIVVTAHLDEIALMVSQVEPDGRVSVIALGGLYPWKWGEQAVEIMTDEPVPAIVSFGCIHTNSPFSVAQQGRVAPLTWDQAYLFTGKTARELNALGVRPGVRVALARDARTVREIGPYLCAHFLDDRADLAAMLLVLETLKGEELPAGVVFAATASEEVGGHGAKYLMQKLRPEICIALEIGPSVPESPFTPDSQPTIWVNDGYASIEGRDIREMAAICKELDIEPHWQALSRGGSDASVAAGEGLCARPITLGLPVENSHGLEIMHRDAPRELARLCAECVRRWAR